ncbi:LAQU0S10e00628g1_1 [Lachancea quebecensis]|uniref:Leucine carboxyl methyltransferase 1 n=1 Tax=Lachancea quebecensis TaxID=1654605 RepID=A0A0P1KT95_9SACH|nr:LAQU0S10e00628g1_1 [Lachancea quebecensis]
MNRAVQETDYDAFSCKVSAIAKHYLPRQVAGEEKEEGEFVQLHMAYAQGLKSVSRRAYSKVDRAVKSAQPVMNYGTYLRSIAIDEAIACFLKEHANFGADAPVQVVNLGCGSDLRMVQLLSQVPHMKWLDLDFKESVALKSRILKDNSLFQRELGPSEATETAEYSTSRYCLASCNLNDIAQVAETLKRFTTQDCPTLVLSECVLCYMKSIESRALIDYIKSFYKTGTWISYDPIGGDDSADKFGKIMQTNLRESRHLEMPTLMIFNSPEKYVQRFDTPPPSTSVVTMWQYYVQSVSSEEKMRLKALQFLDEIEELEIILSHYILAEASWL